MSDTAPIRVVVVQARPDGTWQKSLTLAAGASVGQALAAAGITANTWPDGTVGTGVGIYGRVVDLSQPVSDGDRIELYRPLFFDPKESRRRRAAHRQAARQQARVKASAARRSRLPLSS